MKRPQTCCDWARLLGDMAYLLGEPTYEGSLARMPVGTPRLAKYLGVSRTTLCGWIDGGRVEWAMGESLIERWSVLTGKPRTFIPITVVTLSAAKVR